MNPRRWMQVGFAGVAFLVVFVLLLSPLTQWYVENIEMSGPAEKSEWKRSD